MLKMLLTLLALCTGFVSVAEPARAAVSSVEAVGVADRLASAATVSFAGQRPSAEPYTMALADKSKLKPRPTVVLVVPAVMLRVDRSRE